MMSTGITALQMERGSKAALLKHGCNRIAGRESFGAKHRLTTTRCGLAGRETPAEVKLNRPIRTEVHESDVVIGAEF